MEPGMRPARTLSIPSPSLVVMIGIAGSGKTTFCRRHFKASQIVSSDDARAAVETVPLACDLRHEQGPFDFIGDVHGCARELSELLRRLGYRRSSPRAPFRHPAGRRAVLLGDLVDRGPRVIEAVRIAMRMVDGGAAFCGPGNHYETRLRCLDG